MRDPFIAEIRKIRSKMYKEFEKDPDAFWARIKAIEEKHKDRLVRLKPRRLSKSAA